MFKKPSPFATATKVALTIAALLAVVQCVHALHSHDMAERTRNPLWYCHSDSVDVIGKDFSKCPRMRGSPPEHSKRIAH